MSSGASEQTLLALLLARQSSGEDSVPLSSATDETLVLAVEAGNSTAAAVLFDRYADLIMKIGLRLLRDPGEAEDLVQEVFLGLVQKVRGFDPAKGTARTWIIQIAYRRAFDRRAYLKRRSFYDGADVEGLQNTLIGAHSFEQQVLDSVTGEQLHASFADLSGAQRKTLELFFFEGLSLREIGEQLGETLENIRHFYYRGLEKLRKSAVSLSKNDEECL